MEYPRFVFISPGKNKCAGGTYDHELVRDASEHKAALEAGYSDSIPDALESAQVESKAIESEIDEKPAAKRGRPAKDKE